MMTEVVKKNAVPEVEDHPPEPSELKLIVIVCKTVFQCNLNLHLIAQQLPLDDLIVGKKLIGVVEEGCIKSRNKRKKVKAKVHEITTGRFFQSIDYCGSITFHMGSNGSGRTG